ncbi:hypothetical protein [Latilactobacillus sakei]|uniref:hypothetical protein n=1 Tax=Latilactobacillus sakei TaxID=1599 RepID=UPI000508509B|nr:hypothetical protein KY41_11265 [Latilactobacillus sakei]
MNFYTEKYLVNALNLAKTRIDTIATDYSGDQMIFYRDGDHFSDGGYYYYEIEMVYQHKAKRICEAIAHNNFCKFENEEFVCESVDRDVAVMQLIQCGTAVGTYIMFNRG